MYTHFAVSPSPAFVSKVSKGRSWKLGCYDCMQADMGTFYILEELDLKLPGTTVVFFPQFLV